jgi:hypothetical protein
LLIILENRVTVTAAMEAEQIEFYLEKLSGAKDLLDRIEKYYPRNQISPKTQFAVEELFESLENPIGGNHDDAPTSNSSGLESKD